MRLHREREIVNIRKAFDNHKDATSGKLTQSGLPKALKDININPPEPSTADTKAGSTPGFTMPTGDLGFDGYLELVDELRKVRVAEGRRRAGFSTQEIERFRKMFDAYDADHSGLIDAKEVSALLTDLNFKLRTIEERDNVLIQVDKARQSAAEAGVENVGVSGGDVSFWVFIQLLRVLYNRDDKRVLDREAHAAEQSRFSQTEIEEFREVFINWWGHEKNFEDEEEDNQPGAHDEPEVEPEHKEISKDGMRRLLRQLGCNLTAQQKEELERKIEELDQVHHHHSPHVDFASFLRLMRWMLDSNFAGINNVSAKAAK
jgi:Ca2+-binding EF-hand superfamily protein